MSLFRGILLGAGGALGVCSQTDSLNDIPRSLLRGALTGYDKISRHHTNPDGNNGGATSDDMKDLSRQLQELKQISASRDSDGRQIVVYGGSSGTGTIVKIVIVTTAGAVVLYYFGYGFNDIMYVTKSTLSKAVKGIEDKVNFVGVKLEKTKDELLAMISSVEEMIFSTSKDMEAKIDAETGRIRSQIDELDVKFGRIESSQHDIKSTASSLDARIAILQQKFDKNGDELEKANNGIRLLVNSVMDLPHIRANNGLVSDLRQFLSNNISWFGRQQSTSDDDQKKSNEKKAVNGLYGLAGAI